MKRIEIEAKVENLPEVLSFVDEVLDLLDCSVKDKMRIDVAVEEIYVNIASYAYPEESGTAEICLNYADPSTDTDRWIEISFADRGIPYNPLAREDPRTDLPVEEREIGGLGILMVKKSMDSVKYDFREGCNVLTLKKNLAG